MALQRLFFVPAYKGTGLKAGKDVAAVARAAGIRDLLNKSGWTLTLWSKCCKSNIKCFG